MQFFIAILYFGAKNYLTPSADASCLACCLSTARKSCTWIATTITALQASSFTPLQQAPCLLLTFLQTGASLNLTDFCKKFGGGAAPPALGNAREYNIDLIPK